MPITVSEFNDIERKVITLMGMSGVGKTYLSSMLARQGWYHYSCDYEIGTRFLGDEIVQTLGVENTITRGDISQLSDYVGRLGNPDKGGMSLEEFRRRQNAYFNAECAALARLPERVRLAHEQGIMHVVNDSTGSMCEIDDKILLDMVDENSLIVYIKASPEEEKVVLERAKAYPKPLFYSPERFDRWLSKYEQEEGVEVVEDIDPDNFSRWAFPRLFENRLPKYQFIADKYGVTIPSEAFRGVESEAAFLDVIVEGLHKQEAMKRRA
ncbi:MAG TPA: ATPase [Alphaproteobacteria bacterium]|nr:ATPase [Alphaproteobacteria bacterium]USO05950.1 MAG: ATPase [Rhodospirillales bacterium]HOO82430.1 ATPase [Alphaproteobacteria bacterium]